MNDLPVTETETHIVCRCARVEIASEHVEIRKGVRWHHVGSIQAVRDNPGDFNLTPFARECVETLWRAM